MSFTESSSNWNSPPFGIRIQDRKRAFIRERLTHHYPSKITIAYSALFVLIGLTTVTLQIILIVNQAFNNQIANGIWGGIVCIAIAILNLNLSN